MNFGTRTFRSFGGLAVFGAVLLGGCDAATSVASGVDGQEVTAATLDPHLAQPVAGDLWAAKLDEFSDYEFGERDNPLPDAYGLMKVIEVDDDQVTVVTEQGAWPHAEGTLDELRGDLSAISWDESESIPINRADLASLVDAGHILDTRRLDE